MSTTAFRNHHDRRQFFERLQEFRWLRILYIMPAHLWTHDRMHKGTTSNLHNTNNRDGGSSGSHQRSTNHDVLPETYLYFPSIKDLYICNGAQKLYFSLEYESEYVSTDAVTLSLALLVVTMTPSLRFFSLGDKAVMGVKRSLQKRFRHILFEGDQL
jgi:hypothetical protein